MCVCVKLNVLIDHSINIYDIIIFDIYFSVNNNGDKCVLALLTAIANLTK